jgi:adenylate cyclase
LSREEATDEEHSMTSDAAPHHHGREYLKELLSVRNQYPERAEEIDAKIREAFEQRIAILVLDLCGFSRLTAKYGIIRYLAIIHQMDTVARPAVADNGGVVIKQEADNLFAAFDTPADAVEAAVDIFRAFDAVNSALPDERDLAGSIGIGYGDTLVIGGEDMFGGEMNFASKLGEDLAGEGEILITASAYAELDPDRYICVPRSFATSGVDISCYQLERVARRGTTSRLTLPEGA